MLYKSNAGTEKEDPSGGILPSEGPAHRRAAGRILWVPEEKEQGSGGNDHVLGSLAL